MRARANGNAGDPQRQAGTACASDSKKFGAWDGNLITEWHVRYGRSRRDDLLACRKGFDLLFSQVKRCSSSEVAAMIKACCDTAPTWRSSANMSTAMARAPSALLSAACSGFELAPRLKAIARQKLALPHPGLRAELPNLLPILSNVITWEEIEQHHDEMVKYATATHSGLADPEAILRRFARAEVMYPTYKAPLVASSNGYITLGGG